MIMDSAITSAPTCTTQRVGSFSNQYDKQIIIGENTVTCITLHRCKLALEFYATGCDISNITRNKLTRNWSLISSSFHVYNDFLISAVSCMLDPPINFSPKPGILQGTTGKTLKDPGYHELEFCEGPESDLQDKLRFCAKNPGHKKFIPVTDFKLEHLDKGFQDQRLFDYIVALMAVTVRVVVRYTSTQRPPNYPRRDISGTSRKSFGSGWVHRVQRMFTDLDGNTCPCPECETLPMEDRKKQWGEFVVWTALHVVYDDEECCRTFCDVDFDRDTDRDTCPKLQGVKVLERSLKTDSCLMVCVSHDMGVCDMLVDRIGSFDDLHDKLRDRYRSSGPYVHKHFKHKRPIACVSHPHGMTKQVSFGVWTNLTHVPPRKWRYSTSTCPGSSGAPILDLWGERLSLAPGYITSHSGHVNSKENESGGPGANGKPLRQS